MTFALDPSLSQHQRQLSLPSSGLKASPKRGFFKDEADNLKKMLGVKRLSRWMLTPDCPSSSSREFYRAWQRRPLDHHGLILPCVDGPRLQLWTQRYLRWVQEVQIFGGGRVTVLSRLYDLLEEVRGLRKELDRRAGSGPPASWLPRTRGSGGETQTWGSLVRLSSSFPFSSPRSNSFYKPSIPSSLLHGLGEGAQDLDDPQSVV